MTDRILTLSKELLETENLDEARALARQLQMAIRDRIDNLHSRLREIQIRDTQHGETAELNNKKSSASGGGLKPLGRLRA